MWCSRMSNISEPQPDGFAYAEEAVPVLEAAFTLALQAVLTEQPSDPVAWAAGFLGELAAERAKERELRELARPSVAAREQLEQTSAALDAAPSIEPALASTISPTQAVTASFQATALAPLTPKQTPTPAASDAEAALMPRLARVSASGADHSLSPTDSRGVATPRLLASGQRDGVVSSPLAEDGRDPFNLGIVSSTPRDTRICASPRSAASAPSPGPSAASPNLDAEDILRSLRAGSPESIQRLANSIAMADREGRGKLKLREFTRAFSQARLRIDASKAARLHGHFDKNGKGEIALSDFVAALKQPIGRSPDRPRSSPRPRAQPLDIK